MPEALVRRRRGAGEGVFPVGCTLAAARATMTPVTLPAGFVASLRVYEPLAAYDGPERRRWQAYVAAEDRPGPSDERANALRAMLSRPPRLPDADEALVLEVDGVTLVCPWHTAVRGHEALLDFCAELPDVLADAFVPPSLVELAEVELDRWRVERGTTATHVRTCTWQVPLQWFVLVDAAERVVSLGEPEPGAVRRTGRSLVYRTPMSRARRRVARALSVLRRGLEDSSVVDDVEDLGRWLEEFHPRSVVELDYGDLVHLLDDAELGQDASARDVTLALAKLSEGDGDGAAAAYGRVLARMKALQAVESAN